MKTTRVLVLIGSCLSVGATALWTPGCSGSGGGSDGGADSGPADSGGGGDSGGVVVSCANYCAAVKANCTGANQQYPDDATCMAVCKALTLGAAGDTSMNTVACRQYHATAIGGNAMAAAQHCPHAGPWGDNTCGQVCDAYCAIETGLCTGANAQFQSANDCKAACAAWTEGDAGASSGNSLSCREYHMTVAVTMQAAHCPHTGNTTADAGNPCGP